MDNAIPHPPMTLTSFARAKQRRRDQSKVRSATLGIERQELNNTS